MCHFSQDAEVSHLTQVVGVAEEHLVGCADGTSSGGPSSAPMFCAVSKPVDERFDFRHLNNETPVSGQKEVW